jgi:hypothetical protein
MGAGCTGGGTVGAAVCCSTGGGNGCQLASGCCIGGSSGAPRVLGAPLDLRVTLLLVSRRIIPSVELRASVPLWKVLT